MKILPIADGEGDQGAKRLGGGARSRAAAKGGTVILAAARLRPLHHRCAMVPLPTLRVGRI